MILKQTGTVVIVTLSQIHSAKVCVPDIIKNVTVKMFDFMTLTNKTKQVIFHESCKCICRLDPIVCNKNKDGIKINVDVSV